MKLDCPWESKEPLRTGALGVNLQRSCRSISLIRCIWATFRQSGVSNRDLTAYDRRDSYTMVLSLPVLGGKSCLWKIRVRCRKPELCVCVGAGEGAY